MEDVDHHIVSAVLVSSASADCGVVAETVEDLAAQEHCVPRSKSREGLLLVYLANADRVLTPVDFVVTASTGLRRKCLHEVVPFLFHVESRGGVGSEVQVIVLAGFGMLLSVSRPEGTSRPFLQSCLVGIQWPLFAWNFLRPPRFRSVAWSCSSFLFHGCESIVVLLLVKVEEHRCCDIAWSLVVLGSPLDVAG